MDDATLEVTTTYAASFFSQIVSTQRVHNPFWPGWEEDNRPGNIDVIEFVLIETEFQVYPH